MNAQLLNTILFVLFLLLTLVDGYLWMRVFRQKRAAPPAQSLRIRFSPAGDGGGENGQLMATLVPTQWYHATHAIWVTLLNLLYLFPGGQFSFSLMLTGLGLMLLALSLNRFIRSLGVTEFYENAIVRRFPWRSTTWRLADLTQIKILATNSRGGMFQGGPSPNVECIVYQGANPVITCTTAFLLYTDLSPFWTVYGENNANVAEISPLIEMD